MKPGAVDCKKMRRLARALAAMEAPVSYAAQAPGHMERLWRWAWAVTDDGDLSLFDAEDLAAAAAWRGDPQAFVDLLVDVEFLDRGEVFLRLHDAPDHRPDYVRKRIQEREKYRSSGKSGGRIPESTPEEYPEDFRKIRRSLSPPSAYASALASDPSDPPRPSASDPSSSEPVLPLDRSPIQEQPTPRRKEPGRDPALEQQVDEVLGFFAVHTRKSIRVKAEGNRKPVRSALKDGWTVQDCEAVIRDRQEKWGYDPKMAEFVRLQTIFGVEKREGYLTAAQGSKPLFEPVDDPVINADYLPEDAPPPDGGGPSCPPDDGGGQ